MWGLLLRSGPGLLNLVGKFLIRTCETRRIVTLDKSMSVVYLWLTSCRVTTATAARGRLVFPLNSSITLPQVSRSISLPFPDGALRMPLPHTPHTATRDRCSLPGPRARATLASLVNREDRAKRVCLPTTLPHRPLAPTGDGAACGPVPWRSPRRDVHVLRYVLPGGLDAASRGRGASLFTLSLSTAPARFSPSVLALRHHGGGRVAKRGHF